MTRANLRVATSIGTVEGFANDHVRRWRAIPYARPPIGALRLRAPQPAEPWRGLRYCDEFAFCAPQERKYTLIGMNKFQPMSEDCLTLNVVTPRNPADEPLPVLFFIHGGGYMLGSTATPIYDGAALARRGCIFVSANYRLGALGCLDLSSLATSEHPIDGNLFLRDLIMALRWVHDNIAAFGGDPDRVTIFGESAGAHAVMTLLAVPSAQGLFASAIAESTASGMVVQADAARRFAQQFIELLGVEPADAGRHLAAMRPEGFVGTLKQLLDRSAQEMSSTSFAIGPTIDGELLSRDPFDAIQHGEAHRIPLIVGNNAEESRMFTRWLKMMPTTEQNLERLLERLEPAVSQRIRDAYPDYPRPEGCLELSSDMFFGSVSWQLAEAHSQYAPTYRYRYDYAPRILDWIGLGATHTMELLAVFGFYHGTLGSMATVLGDAKAARRVSGEMQTRWREFSDTGTPGTDWPAYDHGRRAVMIFDKHSRVVNDPNPQRRQAWADFTFAR